MALDPIEEAMIAGLTARGYTVTAPDGETREPTKVVEKIVTIEKPVDHWHLRDGVEVKTLRGEYPLREQWRGGQEAQAERMRAHVQIADAMARQLLVDGFIVFHEEHDFGQTMLRAELTIGVPGSKKPEAPSTVTGRRGAAIPDWAIAAASAGLFNAGTNAAITRLATQNFADVEARALAALSGAGVATGAPALPADNRGPRLTDMPDPNAWPNRNRYDKDFVARRAEEDRKHRMKRDG